MTLTGSTPGSREIGRVLPGGVIDRILHSIELLGLFPDLGHAGKLSGTYEWVVGGLPYIIVYTVDRDTPGVTVLAVFYTAQNR